MAKAPKTDTFCKVTPLERKRLDPYNSIYVSLGESYFLDSKKAQLLADLGEVEILAEDVVPPWASVEPAPVATKPAIAPAVKTETSK